MTSYADMLMNSCGPSQIQIGKFYGISCCSSVLLQLVSNPTSVPCQVLLNLGFSLPADLPRKQVPNQIGPQPQRSANGKRKERVVAGIRISPHLLSSKLSTAEIHPSCPLLTATTQHSPRVTCPREAQERVVGTNVFRIYVIFNY